MRTNGSKYVAIVGAALAAYFVYQWWFNPHRVIQRRLGHVAAALSAPANETDVERLARLARLRTYLSPNVHVRAAVGGPEIPSRDALFAALASWTAPPGGMNVDFVDVQVNVDTDTTARAFLTVEVTTEGPQDPQPTQDTREARVALAIENGEWVITAAEPNDLQRP